MAWERWKQFARRLRPRLDTLVGVDFGGGAVKVAEVSLSSGRPYLKTFAVVEAPEESRQEQPETEVEQGPVLDTAGLSERLERALSLSGIRTKNAVLAVGGRMIFVREVAFPYLAPEELAEAVKWEIPKYVPYEVDSYEFDFAVTGQDAQTGDLRILIVAAPKQIVQQLTQVVRGAGLSPVAVDIEPMAVYRTLSGADNAMILDVGTVDTQISLFQKGNPVFTRMVPFKTGSYAEAAAMAAAGRAEGTAAVNDIMDELGQEVRRTSQFFDLHNKQASIDKVFLTGATNLDSIVQQLRTRVDQPVFGHNPLAGVELSPSLSAAHAGKVGPQLAVAIGLAMRGDEP